MDRRSTGRSLDMKRVGVSRDTDTVDGCEKRRCVAWERGTSAAEASEEAVGTAGRLDAIDWRSKSRGSCSTAAIVKSFGGDN